MYDRTCKGCKYHLGGNKCKFWEDGTCFTNGCNYKQKREVKGNDKISNDNTNVDTNIKRA